MLQYNHFPVRYMKLPEGSPIKYLVGGLEQFLFFHVLGIIIPTDEHIFQRGWNQQPNTEF